MWLDRIFPLALDEDNDHYEALLSGFRLFLLIHLAAETWFVALTDAPDHSSAIRTIAGVMANGNFILPTLLLVALYLGAQASTARFATGLAAVGRIGFLLQTFPYTANHVFLEIICCVALTVFDLRQRDERLLAMGALRWTVAILFTYTGLQKVLYGYYFHGEFLAVALSWDNRYATMLQHFLPEDEFLRLRAFGQPHDGSGPYWVNSLPFVMLSNLVWIGEIVLGMMLVPAATRTLAVFGTIAFMMFMQLNAHEVFFGGLFTNLTFLFLKRNLIRPLIPAFAVLYGVALLSRLGLMTDTFFN